MNLDDEQVELIHHQPSSIDKVIPMSGNTKYLGRLTSRETEGHQNVHLRSCWNTLITTLPYLVIVGLAGILIFKNMCWTSQEEVALIASVATSKKHGAIPLVHAHSHNDYLQPIPFQLAVEAGFMSIEVDVHLDRGELRVGHVFAGSETIEQLYLEPIKKHLDENDMKFYPRANLLGIKGSVTLLVDMKTDSFETWDTLERSLKKIFGETGGGYIDCTMRNSNEQEKIGNQPVQVVVSGVPESEIPEFASHIVSKSSWCSYLDGRPIGTVSNSVQQVQRLTSPNLWHYTTSALEATSVDELDLQQIQALIQETRTSYPNSKIRFWNVPEVVEIWEMLLLLGADTISTDRIYALRSFLLSDME